VQEYDDKQSRYKELVKARKRCRECSPMGFTNQSQIKKGKYDKETIIGAWSLWQGSLDAKILLVGQDWGNKYSYEKDCGKSGVAENDVTDNNLIELFRSIGIHVAHPKENVQNPLLFFTNAVLCLKDGGLAAKVPQRCYNACANLYLRSLIEIIQPKIIITLGKKAYESVVKLYSVYGKDQHKLIFREVIKQSPIQLSSYSNLPAVKLLPAPHCGQYSSNTFIGFEDQKEIWASIKDELDTLC
jgi:DNA polymerase